MSRRSERKERVKRRLLIRKLCRWVPIAMRLDFGDGWRRAGLRAFMSFPKDPP